MSYEFDDHVLEHWDEYCAINTFCEIINCVIPLAAAAQLGRTPGADFRQGFRCPACGSERFNGLPVRSCRGYENGSGCVFVWHTDEDWKYFVELRERPYLSPEDFDR